MSTQFECRFLLESEYQVALSKLESVCSGDVTALVDIRDHCRNLLQTGSFRKWHSGLDEYVYKAWQKEVDGISIDISDIDIRRIGEILIALTAMPDFQMSYYYSDEKSPNLVVLGNGDGGLYGVLCDADHWFDSLFMKRFPHSVAKFGVGRAMIVLDQDDIIRFQKVVVNLAKKRCIGARSVEACWWARERLLRLLNTCLVSRDGRLAISESG